MVQTNVFRILRHTGVAINRRCPLKTAAWRHYGILASCVMIVLLLSGCFRESGGVGQDSLLDQTAEIAQAYAQHGNVEEARAQLDALDVANGTQWLIYVAETYVAEQRDAAATVALVRLALALDTVHSGSLQAFAQERGLLPADDPGPDASQQANTVPDVVAIEPQPLVQPSNSSTGETGHSTDATDEEATESTPGNAEESALETAPTPAPPTPTSTPTTPMVSATTPMNVRGGPGTAYPVVGALDVNTQAQIVGKNNASDWWQVTLPSGELGWVIASLVATNGDTSAVALAQNIPPLPPTATPAPVAQAAPEQAAPEQAAPEQAAPEAAPPAAAGPDFRLIERRLWSVEETGGRMHGNTVVCGEKHELYVHVVDANGNPLNGVAVQSVYNGETYVTGEQGKGDGTVEYILWGAGQGVKVARDVDGREVSSDTADGMTPKSPEIPHEDLISAGYCTDTASCNKFNESLGCWGHHSWTVKFQRSY